MKELILKLIAWLLELFKTAKSVKIEPAHIANNKNYFKVIYTDGWMPVEEEWYEESRKIVDNKIFIKMVKIADTVKEVRWFYHDHNGKLNIVLRQDLLDEFKDE